jgi:hypothetical protein
MKIIADCEKSLILAAISLDRYAAFAANQVSAAQLSQSHGHESGVLAFLASQHPIPHLVYAGLNASLAPA